MATENQEKEAAYVRDHWDAQGKLVGYLITAHGAVLVGCLAALRDYPSTPLFTGIGL
ncbi:hypothetical protein [Bradyrhizobium sp. LTSP857]|uniref:hypothetical protein n=1 Tax=Bradyrhizobium sp. LTSP857 TaxID=1619231 RepID=UPI000AB21283|nr:hypothetical protein [Bradyrhizobium sp. LTSP857]